MDLPSHLLYTYAVEKVSVPVYISNHPDFVVSSLIFSCLPDIFETTPFLVYLYFNQKKYSLDGFKSIINFSTDITHNRSEEYVKNFKWASNISFYTHSYLVYIFIALILYFYTNWLFLPFIAGYGFHLFTDMLVHNDYFS